MLYLIDVALRTFLLKPFFSSVGICLFLLPQLLFADILLDEVMSPDEQEKTGVANLNAEQKAFLEEWLNENFTPIKRKSDFKKDLSLSVNLDQGKRLELSDGSVYEVAPSDLLHSALWLTPFPIHIEASEDPEYPWRLVNTNTGFGVNCKLIHPPTREKRD